MANMIIISDTQVKRKEDGKVFSYESLEKLKLQHKIVGDERKPKAAPKPVVAPVVEPVVKPAVVRTVELPKADEE